MEEEIVRILVQGTEWCECRHSPHDGHDYNPPCSTVLIARERAREILALLNK